jgi:RNA recognition motif-containing protein
MKNLFVGNMSFKTTESDLNELFKPFGQVARIHVAIDRETGRSRGFAFVEMPNDEEAARAIAGSMERRSAAVISRLTKHAPRPSGARRVAVAVEDGPDSQTKTIAKPRANRVSPGGNAPRASCGLSEAI